MSVTAFQILIFGKIIFLYFSVYTATTDKGKDILAAVSEKVSSDVCAQRRFRAVYAFMQSHPNLHSRGTNLDSRGRNAPTCGQRKL